MSDDKLRPIEYPAESYVEASLQTAKSIADVFGSLVPIIGPAIGKSIEGTLKIMHKNRVRELITSLNQYLIDMPENMYKSEEFAEAIKIGISRYINEGSKEKRLLLINLNKSLMCLLHSNEEGVFDLYLVFDKLFEQLSLASLQALMLIQKNIKGKAQKRQIIKHLLDTQEIHGRRSFSELVSQGLLEEEEEYNPLSFNLQSPKVTDDYERIYRISPLGGVFLCWLRHELDDHLNEMSSTQP